MTLEQYDQSVIDFGKAHGVDELKASGDEGSPDYSTKVDCPSKVASPKPPPGERIKQFRKELVMTIFELSEKAGGAICSDIAAMEEGNVDPLTLDLRTAIKIAKALGRTLDEV